MMFKAPHLVVLALVLVACAAVEEPATSATYGPGAETPEAAVGSLIAHLNTPDFPAAASFGVPEQAALASLAEGATFNQVSTALLEGDLEVAGSFWAGFAQGTGSFLTGEVETRAGGTHTQDDIEFHSVVVVPESGEEREMLVRDVDGYRVDIFATFGAALAERMLPPVERLLASQTDESRVILSALKQVVPSLLVSAGQPGLSPQAVQNVLRLVELITRVG